MDKMLYDMRKDAIKKLADTNEEDQILLLDAVTCLIYYSELVHSQGIPALFGIAEIGKSDYLAMLSKLIADFPEPELVIELGTNAYWIQNPQGISAMEHYVYLRGMLFIQEGISLWLMVSSLQTLFPAKWQTAYYKRFEKILDSEWYSKWYNKWWNEKIVDVLPHIIHPVFEKAELLEKISALEMKIEKMDDRFIENLLDKVNNIVLEKCLYGFNQETRERITSNLSEELSYIVMEDTAYLAERGLTETEILEAMIEIDHVIDGLTG